VKIYLTVVCIDLLALILGASVAEWLRLLTSNHLPLTTVGLSLQASSDSFMLESYPASLRDVGGSTWVPLNAWNNVQRGIGGLPPLGKLKVTIWPILLLNPYNILFVNYHVNEIFTNKILFKLWPILCWCHVNSNNKKKTTKKQRKTFSYYFIYFSRFKNVFPQQKIFHVRSYPVCLQKICGST
jgi:hypothetical protein